MQEATTKIIEDLTIAVEKTNFVTAVTPIEKGINLEVILPFVPIANRDGESDQDCAATLNNVDKMDVN